MRLLLFVVEVPLLLQASTTLLLGISLLALSRRYDREYMRLWGRGWIFATVGSLGAAVSFDHNVLRPGGAAWIGAVAVLCEVGGVLAQSHLQIAGSRVLEERRHATGHLRVVVWVAIAVYSALALLPQPGSYGSWRLLMHVGIPFALLGGAFMISALAVYRGSHRGGFGYTVLPIAFAFYGIQRVANALHAGQIVSLPFGEYAGFIDIPFLVVVALGTIAWFLEEERQALLELQAREEEMTSEMYRARRIESLAQFAGSIAHDFNNILTVVGPQAELIRDEADDPEEVRRSADQILSASSRARTLVRYLRAFARVRVRKEERVDVPEVVRGLSDLARTHLDVQIPLDVVASPDIPEVLSDRDDLSHVLLALIGSAWEAGQNTQRSVRIEVQSRTEMEGATSAGCEGGATGPWVAVRILGAGEGMDEDDLRQALDPFSTPEAGSAIGLGITAASGFVREHGGCLTLESDEGRATTLVVLLPSAA